MPTMVVRQKVESFTTWKAAFDAQADVRKQMGSKGGQLLRNSEDPNEVMILLEVDDDARAHFDERFLLLCWCAAGTEDPNEATQLAGVMRQPDVFFLDEAGRPAA